MHNEISLDRICASLTYAMGIDAPEHAAPPHEELVRYVDEAFGGKKADRVFMYNPDAIPQWIYEKYKPLFREVNRYTDVEVPLAAALPSVTPVCFGTMYTGAQPAVHGIRKYEKPVITIDSIFDALIRAGKKPAIVAVKGGTMSRIYLEREMDYYVCSTYEEVNAKAIELILEDKHDFIAVHTSNYDSRMHKTGPESADSLGELRFNAIEFGVIHSLIKKHWKDHNVFLGFAMDHGCHEIGDDAGSHGLDMDEDVNIVHFYKAIPAKTDADV